MAGVESRSFESPDETRKPDKTQVDVVRMGTTTAGRFAFEPGWRWSECVKPVAGTDSCQLRHVGVVQSGRLVIAPADIRHAASGLYDIIKGRPPPIRAGFAETNHGAIHEVRIELRHRIESQPQSLRCHRPHVDQQAVAARDQLADDLPSRGTLQVDRNGAFVPVVVDEHGAVAGAFALGQGVAGDVALERFELDDLRAEVGQNLTGQRPHDHCTQLEKSNALQ